MPDLHGKYIAFCSGRAHMREMMQKSFSWFRKADEHPCFYSVWAESPTAEQDFNAFKEDASDHLRLLFCIDMFNEGIHIQDISGVILFRPTVSPILYKQQIGRALSTLHPGKTTRENNHRENNPRDNNPRDNHSQGDNLQRDNPRSPVIFDVVNNFENIDSVAALRKEIDEEIAKGNESIDPSLADTQKEPVAPFRIIDEVRECRELFRKLEDTLSHSWEAMYREAETYYRQNGHLQVPKHYRTPEGARLGNWIETQRCVKRGALYGDLTEEKIRRLEQIGMNWTTRSETSLEEGLSHAKAYKEQFGNLNVTSRYISPDGYRLGHWISAARGEYAAILNSKSGESPFDIPKLKALDELGMIWNKADESFQRGLRAAKEYAERNGNLEVSFIYGTGDGFALGKWLESQRTWMKNNKANRAGQTEVCTAERSGYALEHQSQLHMGSQLPNRKSILRCPSSPESALQLQNGPAESREVDRPPAGAVPERETEPGANRKARIHSYELDFPGPLEPLLRPR